MQHFSVYATLPLLAAVLCVPAQASPEESCGRLRAGLEREVQLMAAMTDATSVAEKLPQLQAVLAELAAMDRSPEAQKELWLYIDNTEGVKLPLIELVQQLCVQLQRLQKQAFYGHEGLRAALAPQLPPDQSSEPPAAH